VKVSGGDGVKVEGGRPLGVDICAMVDEELDDLGIATCTSGMEREDSVDYRIDGLAMTECVLDKPNITRGRSIM
jgi:hypothetical protein